MKNLKHLAYLFLVLLFITSCEKETEVVFPQNDLIEQKATINKNIHSLFNRDDNEVLVDEVPAGSLSEWTVNDTGGNPYFTYVEIESSLDGSTAIKTSVVGVTISMCPSQNIQKVYNISGNTNETKLKAYLEFTSSMDYYNFPYVVVYIYDEFNNQVGAQVFYGQGVISGLYEYYANDAPESYTELDTASGDAILDLSTMGEDIVFSSVRIVLANYACVGENSIVFDHLRVINQTVMEDYDGDLIADNEDNCPETANGDQADFDNDGMGDVCDIDIDNDGVLNENDSHPYSDMRQKMNIGGTNTNIDNKMVKNGSIMMDQLNDLIAQTNEQYNGENYEYLHKRFMTKLAQLTYNWRTARLITATQRSQISSIAWGATIPFYIYPI
jgi:hypothetical protein